MIDLHTECGILRASRNRLVQLLETTEREILFKIPEGFSNNIIEFNAETKNLTFINSQKSGGENPVYVSVHPDGRWLVKYCDLI